MEKLAKELQKELNTPETKKLVYKMLNILEKYKKDFLIYAKNRQEALNIIDDMRLAANKAEKKAIELRVSQKNQKEALYNKVILIIASISLIVAILLVVLTMLISKEISQEIEIIKNDLENRNGDLTREIVIDANNEIKTVAYFINSFIKKMRDVISTIVEVSKKAFSISKRLTSITDKMEKRVQSEALIAKETMQTTEETLQKSNFVSEKVNEVEKIANESFEKLTQATQNIEDMIEKIKLNAQKEQNSLLKLKS
ncbi:hypothetical protein [Caminibacter sp.]